MTSMITSGALISKITSDLDQEWQIATSKAPISNRTLRSLNSSSEMLVTVLDDLASQGKLDFYLLKYQDIADFWHEIQTIRNEETLHREALDKLRTQFTAEELRLLRIKLPE